MTRSESKLLEEIIVTIMKKLNKRSLVCSNMWSCPPISAPSMGISSNYGLAMPPMGMPSTYGLAMPPPMAQPSLPFARPPPLTPAPFMGGMLPPPMGGLGFPFMY